MRRLFLLLFFVSTLSLSPLFGAYTYYVTDPLNSLNNSAPNFDINGSSTNNTGTGLTASTAGGGSFISRVATPDGSSQVEVAATLKLANSGGNYVIYLGATPNALLGSTSTGSFYAFAINNPTFANGGCTANLVLYRVVNGSVTQIGSTVIPCSDGVVYQTVLGNDNALRFWVNNVEYFYWLDVQPLQGKGGVGGYSMPTGNGISLIRIGACDRIAPTAVDPASIQNYALSNRVDLRTAGSADDVNGSGVNVYNWFRNGAYVTSTCAPEFSDVNVTPGTTNNYAVQVQDHHGNGTGLISFSIPVPSTAVLDARQVGVRPTGSYWGGMGEQIDMRSGNLNFTYPLMAAQSRGWSMPLALNYNSQNWRLDSSGAPWRLGYDVGFGFGWKLQIGSLTPFYSTYTSVQFYEYSDPSGATYRLDQNNNGLWTSRESVYVTYDSNTQRLRFNNGSFWVLGCTSAGTEQDAGTMYPTLIEDSNGNQITVEYAAGIGVTWLNSSARLRSVRDVRPGTNPTSSPTYSFTYNNDVIPHLTAIANAINSQDSFAFSYGAPLTLASPFGTAQNFGTVGALATVQNNATNLTTSFDYDAASSGELLQVTFPLGGHIRWEFASVPYAQTTVREVNARYLQWDANIGERSFAFTRTAAGSNTFTANRKVVDSQAQAYKNWDFEPSSLATLSLVNDYSEGATGSQQTLRTTRYNWTQDPGGNLYIGRLQVTHNPGQSYAITKQVDQTADAYGNIVQTKLYDFGDLSTPSRTYNTSYLTSANGNNYVDLYIRDRAATTTVTDRNNVMTTLKQNTYDQYPAGITPTANIQQHDAADYGPNFTARGNVYQESMPWIGYRRNYDQTGTALWVGKDVNPNHSVTTTTTQATNYAAPSLITTSSSLQTNFGWSSSLQMTSRVGANQETSTVQYDLSDRPQFSFSPYGAQTQYQYSVSGPQITATTNSRFTKTYLDGLGRTRKVERGDTSGTKSVVDSVYDACACNPMGKLYQVSMPHMTGATPVWTKYMYDSLGRVLTETRPDGQSKTTYVYAGNVVTVTDPAGKWKKITSDSFGQLVRVEEQSPHPGSEPNHVTLYAYDVFGHLTNVRMDRTVGGQVYTQNRSWTYDLTTLRLLSKSAPEAGTTSYTYNADNTLATVTDAKGQRRVHTYDNFGRIIQIARGTFANNTFTENVPQRTTYAYSGTNTGYSSATNGRVSQINYEGPHGLSFVEQYSYETAGSVTKKRVQVAGTPFGSTAINMEATYTHDNEGRVTSVRYPVSQYKSDNTSIDGPRYDYSYDGMGRLLRMTDQANTSLVSDTTYGPADEMLSMVASTFTETRAYNANLQLVDLSSGVNVHYHYNYSATQNNGQIQSKNDLVSGETAVYQYDTLRRLIDASATGDPSGVWSQAFQYDGFGNLTQKQPNNAPALSIAVNPANNRIQTGAGYDANGNMTAYAGDNYAYDIENRMVQATPASGGTVAYGYDSVNHRIYQAALSGTTYSAEMIYFYGADGHKYGDWKINPSSGVLLQARVTKQWFGGRLLTPQDNIQSRGKYFPYGEERTNVTPTNPPNDQEKFATYTRDGATGLDYAKQRYYSSSTARFLQPDPLGSTGDSASPQEWNQYQYANFDPVVNIDPQGLLAAPCGPSWVSDASLAGPCGGTDAPLTIGDPGYVGSWSLWSPNAWIRDPVYGFVSNGHGQVDVSTINYDYILSVATTQQTPATATIKCNILLFEGSAGFPGDPFAHTTVGVQEQVNNITFPPTYFEAGPRSKVRPNADADAGEIALGYAWLNKLNGDPFSFYYKNISHSLRWQSGFSQPNCFQNSAIRINAGRFPSNEFNYGYLSDNSNAFAYSLLLNSGVFYPPADSLKLTFSAPGWGNLLSW